MGEVVFVVLVDFKYFVCDPDNADSQILNSYRFQVFRVVILMMLKTRF